MRKDNVMVGMFGNCYGKQSVVESERKRERESVCAMRRESVYSENSDRGKWCRKIIISFTRLFCNQ